MSQTKYKMPPYIKYAIVWLCRGYHDALKDVCEYDNCNSDYRLKIVNAVDNALYLIGDDIENIELRQKLRIAIWENTLCGRMYPYEVWDLPTIYRDNFYERKRKFIKNVAENMGFI